MPMPRSIAVLENDRKRARAKTLPVLFNFLSFPFFPTKSYSYTLKRTQLRQNAALAKHIAAVPSALSELTATAQQNQQ